MPKGPRFKGQLIVLVSPTNSSATFQFASLVQSSKLGLLVGSPTGGNRRGINGGAFFFLRLPASGLEVDLPLIGTFPATPQPDAGVVPDVTVKETVADIREGVDAVLAAALVIARA
jgi:C-terminal processing protease CtpA/Prc